MDKEYREQSKIVADWVLYYWEHKKDYEAKLERYLQEAVGVGASVLDEVPIRSSLPGDRTGAQAVRLADMRSRIERDREWLSLVEDLERRLPWKMQLILRLRWEVVDRDGHTTRRPRGRPAWIPYCQHKYNQAVAKRLRKRPEDCWVNSPDVFTDWWARIITYATIQAAKRRLI